MLSFDKPYLTGKETVYIADAIARNNFSGDGFYTQKCQQFFEEKYNFKKVLLTGSGTDALDMAAILCDIKNGDEVIVPSYTFVSTVNPFVMQGATILYADVQSTHPCLDHNEVAKLIGPKTKVIVITHYAGVACDMDAFVQLANKHKLILVEDAAQSLEATYKGKPLGSFGQLSIFSFHEKKNISCGEGGMLVINNPELIQRAEIIRQKGTNRTQFFRGEVHKYEWLDIGSSFHLPELISSFLFAQIESLDDIQQKRISIWQKYFNGLKCMANEGFLQLPHIPDYASNNGHIFYLWCRSYQEREALRKYLYDSGINALFHFVPLHTSPFSLKHINSNPPILPNTVSCYERLLRLPLYYELTNAEQNLVIDSIKQFFYAK